MEAGRNPEIAILGAGMSGLCMGIQLKQAGIDSFAIFEKADEVGGTWRDNTSLQVKHGRDVAVAKFDSASKIRSKRYTLCADVGLARGLSKRPIPCVPPTYDARVVHGRRSR